MQQQATTPRDEALIVPTVVDLLRVGGIRFASGFTPQLAEAGGNGATSDVAN